MTISPSLPAEVTYPPLVVTISNVEAEPTSLKVSSAGGSIRSYEIYGMEDGHDINNGCWWLDTAPVYDAGEVTFSLSYNHDWSDLAIVEITINGKTTTFV